MGRWALTLDPESRMSHHKVTKEELSMNLTRHQRKLLNRLRARERAGGLRMKGLGVRLAILLIIYTAATGLILLAFGFWLDRVAPGPEDREFRRAVTAYFFIPFSSAVALVGGGLWMYASYELAMARFWPVVSQIVDWQRVDTLLEPQGSVGKVDEAKP
jgi:hypothetical protein